ncbi:MAG TPA: MlaD family protein [Thermoleophilaceae bacterium]|nr:MlaD family protein [Thermoleophilaceae bacterium]
MVKQTSRFGVLAMVGFTAACVGILLYLWLTFGGSIPLRAEGYRFQVEIPEAGQLTQEADVRISGVNVGKVKTKDANPRTGVTDATIELDDEFAPIPVNTRAILRQKTLLGETYVELTPGAGGGRMLADGGTLPAGAVSPTVELDEIFRAFDPDTRRAFSNWMDEQGRAVGDRGAALNAALANLTPFAEDSEAVIRILKRQDVATRTLVRDTGEVFDALSERRGQLRGLIENSNRVFETTAARNQELADAFVALPTFLRETRTTTVRLSEFAELTDPLVTQLRPAARELSPTLISLQGLAPDLRGLFKGLGPLIRVSRTGLPALERTLDDTKPLLARLEPFLRNLQPVFGYLGLYKREIAAFFALDAAATQVTDRPPGSSRPLHYLRTTNPLNPENLGAYPRRLPSNRSNPYVEPGASDQLRGGLPVFGRYLCEIAGPASFLGPVGPLLPAELRGLLEQFAFAGSTTGAVPAPPCREQAPLGRVVGQSGRYPNLLPIPAP